MSKSDLRMSWAGDYISLQAFVEENLCSVGKWTSIGGEKKQFEGGNFVINWWKNKKYLAISGEKASDTVYRLTSLFTANYTSNNWSTAVDHVEKSNNCFGLRDEVVADTESKKLSYDDVAFADITNSLNIKDISAVTCQCGCNNLSIDVEGIKLDQVVNERNILINASRIKDIESLLTKFQAENEKMKRQISIFEEKIAEPLQKCTKQSLSFQYVNSEQQQSETSERFVSLKNPLENDSVSGDGLINYSVVAHDVRVEPAQFNTVNKHPVQADIEMQIQNDDQRCILSKTNVRNELLCLNNKCHTKVPQRKSKITLDGADPQPDRLLEANQQPTVSSTLVNVNNLTVEESLPVANTEINMPTVDKDTNTPDIIPSSEQSYSAPTVDEYLDKLGHTHKIKLSQHLNSRIDLNYLPLIEIPNAKSSHSVDSFPFQLRSRGKHRPIKSQDWLNYLDFVRKRTRTLKQH